MKVQILRKTRTFLITILSCLLAVCIFGGAKAFSVASADQVEGGQFLPKTELETTALQNASAVYRDDNLTAIIDDSSKLTIYFADSTINVDNLTQMLDIKLFDENTLFFTANARLYAYNLQQKTYEKVLLNDNYGNDVSVSYFDFNDNFLVTTYQEACRIFTISNGTFTSYGSPIPISNGSNVAINSNNQLFIVGSSGIYKTLASEPAIQTPNNTLTDATPAQIIANDEFVYYVINDKVYSISINGGASTQLKTLESDKQYDLGKIVDKADGSSSIKYVSFCQDNLLVVQNDTIQEFEIKDDQLVFTGFAVAKGKSAYNRISENATQIEKTNKNVAVLDPFKLTVYTDNNSDKYSRENYKNYLISNLSQDVGLNQVSPASFALGEQNALLLYNAKTADSFVALLDFAKTENALTKQTPIVEATFIRDVCYQSGYYYILCDDGSAPQNIYTQRIYRASANEQSLEFSLFASFTNPIESLYTIFNVDTYGNVYLANKTTVAQLNKTSNLPVPAIIKSGFNNISKMQSDLLGNLYLLDEGKVYRIQDTNALLIEDVKSFAFDFVDDNLFYLIENSETVYSSTEFDNISINDLKVSDNFYLTNPHDKNVLNADAELKFYTVNAGQNAYVVKKDKGFNAGDTFVYEKLSSNTDEYVLICTIECLGEQRFYVLANQDTFVLVDKNSVQQVDKQKDTIVSPTAYITTNVNAYYLPIITANDNFVLNDGVKAVNLTKSTVIYPQFKINFLGSDYYYAEFVDNGVSKFGYIPCSFTIEVLTQDFAWEEFSVEKVEKTDVYADSDMQEVIYSLNQNTLVKIIEKGDNVCKIGYLDNGEYKIGYIYTSKIINEPSVAIRNILIILAVLTCVFTSSLYFILKKKRA